MRIIKLSFIIAVALLNIAAMPLPDGWRNPTAKETSQDWRNDKHHRYLSVKSDFNGDGITDEAKFLVKQRGQGLALFAFVSQGKEFRRFMLDELEDVGWLEVMGIDLAPKGKHTTACGKGYFDCDPGEPKQVTLTWPSINYFKEESASSFFYWHEKSKKFKRVWISD